MALAVAGLGWEGSEVRPGFNRGKYGFDPQGSRRRGLGIGLGDLGDFVWRRRGRFFRSGSRGVVARCSVCRERRRLVRWLGARIRHQSGRRRLRRRLRRRS